MKDLTSDEILTGVQEFWARKVDKWEKTEEDRRRHEQFWKILENWEGYNCFHGWRHPQTDVSTSWLRRQVPQFFE